MLKPALRLVIFFGLVSLFADVTYEGARSITGPFLATMGASGALIGAIAGFGELVGYGLRFAGGVISDRTRRRWLITFLGYAINLIAVPLLALAYTLPMAAILIIAERLGKAIRTPSRDAMLSYATKELGRGWGFGLHQAMDQIGAIIGPLIVALVLFWGGSYRLSFALLLIPAIAAMSFLASTRHRYPHPETFEPSLSKVKMPLKRSYWTYVVAVSLIGAGYVDFALIAYHLTQSSIVASAWIPALYAIPMAVDGLAALFFGRLYDRSGMTLLAWGVPITALFAPLVFLSDATGAAIGLLLWGIGMSLHESIARAVISNIAPPDRRGTAFGLLYLCFGASWFMGSALLGWLYDITPVAAALFSFAVQAASVPLLLRLPSVNPRA